MYVSSRVTDFIPIWGNLGLHSSLAYPSFPFWAVHVIRDLKSTQRWIIAKECSIRWTWVTIIYSTSSPGLSGSLWVRYRVSSASVLLTTGLYCMRSQMRLKDFIKVMNPFDVVCGEEKLGENERHVLEKTVDVVTHPSDQIINLNDALVNQVFPTASLPPVVADTRKRVNIKTFARESASKKQKGLLGSSSGIFFGWRVWLERRHGGGHLVIKPPLSTALESVVGSSYEAADHMAFSEADSRQLVSKESSKTTISLSSTSTRSQPLVSVHSGSTSSSVSKHISDIIIALVEDSAETPCQDRFYASMSLEPSVANNFYQLDWELTNDFIMDKGELARLRLGKEEADKKVAHLKRHVREMRGKAEKVPRLLARYSKRETELSTLNGKETKVKREFARQLDTQQERFYQRMETLDERLNKMDMETKEEIATTLRDAIETKKSVVSKDFRYFLNKFQGK
nr:hypothetical protein [Tanacetum cinerariifolium]